MALWATKRVWGALLCCRSRLYRTGKRPRPSAPALTPAGEYQPRSKASRVLSVPRIELDFTRTNAPTGILDNKKFTIMDFLKTIGNGVEAHHDKIKTKCRTLRDVLVIKSEVLKGLGLNVRDRKLVLRYAHRYRLGIWRPRKIKTKQVKQPEQAKLPEKEKK